MTSHRQVAIDIRINEGISKEPTLAKTARIGHPMELLAVERFSHL
jgi:hypothetical protein